LIGDEVFINPRDYKIKVACAGTSPFVIKKLATLPKNNLTEHDYLVEYGQYE
jgi:hypothetical protein